MLDFALAALHSRSRQLRNKLESGAANEVVAARENFRLSLVELHHLGYWRERPEMFRNFMQLYRACRCLDVESTSQQSMSVPDRRVQYSP